MPVRLIHTLSRFTGRLVCSLMAAAGAFVRPSVSWTGSIQLQPGRPAGRPAATTGTAGGGCRRTLTAILMTFCLLLPLANASAAPPGTRISNIVSATFEVGGIPVGPFISNPVEIITRSPATIEFLIPAPGLNSAEDINVAQTSYSSSGTAGGPFSPVLPALPAGLTNPVPLTASSAYHTGQPVFLRLTDLDQNLNLFLPETILVRVVCVDTGDVEWLRLTETGNDTGQFTGYIPSTGAAASSGNGALSVVEGCRIDASYTDPFDGSDTAFSAALVDPTGIVFDSSTALPVDGVTVALIDDSTGLPATVFGDDGISSHPATVTTGGSVSDSGGTVYNLPPGGFRFPLIAPGNYRLVITPPAGYVNPSAVADAVLQTLPGAPFALTVGSRGEVFVVNPGPVVHIDIPIDPQGKGLWLRKTVNRDRTFTGDFLQYRLTLENLSDVVAAPGVTIEDRLPTGFRYQHGSIRLDGAKTTDSAVSDDGQLLTFTPGGLAPGQSIEISYVVEVTSGAKPGEAVNRATARDTNAQVSNAATASVEVRSPFFDNTVFLTGRVLAGNCETPEIDRSGIAGVRIYLEDGSYIVTDEHGRYHFEGVAPGLHVVQVDTPSLPAGYELLPCEQTSQRAGRTFSQFVDLQGGTLWNVDFHAAPKAAPTGEVGLQMSASLDGTTATFDLQLLADTVAAEKLRLTIMLPGSSNYLPGTARIDGKPTDEPMASDGTVTFRHDRLDAGKPLKISFQARMDDRQGSGELPAKALLTFDTAAARGLRTPIAETRFNLVAGETAAGEEIKLYPRFPSFVAELQETDRAMLDQLAEKLRGAELMRVDLVGHTDNQQIARRSRHLFKDNQALSVARAASVAAYLQQKLGISDQIVSIRGLGESMPASDNATPAGQALNRRVELNIVTAGSSQTSTLSLTQSSSGLQTVETAGQDPVKVATVVETMTLYEQPHPPQIDAAWWNANLERSSSVVWPPQGYTPENPSLSVMIKYVRGSKLALELNGAPVNPLNFDGVKSQKGGDQLVAVWHGVDLREGQNQLVATLTDQQGSQVQQFTREIWFVDKVAHIELLPERSRLSADGVQPPIIALRLTDKQGHPVRPGLYSNLRVNPPYAIRKEATREASGDESGAKRFATGPDGILLVQLEPTAQAGEAILFLPLSDGNGKEIRIWLKPAPRDWILVGFAEGTVGYNNLSGNQVNLKEAGIDEHFYQDDQIKFFAKGAIKGEWLLTMAYDSKKPNRDGDSLHQAIDPDSYYPLYGDGTQQGYEAASARKLYVKIERDQFYALFGDMQTGLTQTELSQYSRSMNGFKSEMQTEKFSYTLFAADTRQTFAKDEIRGDGTSGRYYLTQRNLVTNSETVTIETRDRFHSEKILDVQTLGRHSDYDIDYDNGSLFFKRPVTSKDANFNPIFIVVRYETLDSSEENLNYGGRVAAKLLEEKVEIGASYVHEARGSGDGDLYGTDLTVKLTPQTTLHAEAATTTSRHFDSKARGDAYLAEVKHDSERVAGRVYYREQQTGFGLGQQNDSEGGTRKYGVETTYNMTPKLSASGLAYHEDQLGTGGKRDVAEVQGRYNAERYSLSSGLREARDQMANGDKQNSLQWLAGGSWSTENRRLTLRSTYEQSLAGSDENSDYPTLLTLGADYKLSEKVSVFVEQEFSWGAREDSMGTRAGFRSTPWQGGTLNSSVERQFNENGQRVFALFGLGQSWQISERWSIDGSLDRSHTLKQPGNDSLNSNVPPAHGTADDFTAVSLGATYKRDKWTWWNRLEVRQADSEDKLGVSTSIVGEPRDGVAVSAKAMAFITDASSGLRSTDGNLRLGLAYRPATSPWIFLNRLDFYFDQEKGGTERYDSWRIVNNFHANFRLSNRLQTSFYSGLKYVRDTFSGDRYDSVTSLLAFEARYNLNRRWDIGVHGGVLHSWNSDTFDYTAGASLGYSPLTNTWISLGYNFVGFRDDDFATANYTAQGAYLRFRAKFDQQSVREAAEWINK